MSLVGSLMPGFVGEYDGRIDRNELRTPELGAWKLFQDQNKHPLNILSRVNREAIKNSFGNTVSMPVMDAGNVVIRNVRSCVVPDAENTSKLITLNFATYVFGFTMTKHQHHNNKISYEEDFNRKLLEGLLALGNILETNSINKLEIEKNQFFDAQTASFYPAVNGALQVSAAQAEDFYNTLSAVVRTMNFGGNVDVLSNNAALPMINRLRAQGNQNGINQAFQFNGLNLDYFSNQLLNDTGVRSTHFVVPGGMLAVENRNDPDAVAGETIGELKEWGTEFMPIVNLEMGTYYYQDCADRSALHAGTTGLTRTKLEGFEFSTDVVWVTPYNSSPANKYSPILKVEVSNT